MTHGSASAGASAAACPLCGSVGDGVALAELRYALVWEALEREWGVRVPPEVALRHTPAEVTHLRECGACGLRFFAPAVAGDQGFYAALAASPDYYRPWKWEFDWVRQRLPADAAVLDVGCGAGDFLASCAGRGGRLVGLERSAGAAAAARARGLEISEDDAGAFAHGSGPVFDAICLFHVVEHLPAVEPFLRGLLACLRPGGSLFISVPDRDRYFKQDVEPLDCPPHHLSRWSAAQLRRLAPRLGLRLAAVAREPVDVTDTLREMPQRLRRRVEALPRFGKGAGLWSYRLLYRTVFRPGLEPLYRRLRLFDRAGCRGATLVAWYILEGKEGGA